MATDEQRAEYRGGIYNVEFALAASATTDGMDITVTVKNSNGKPVTRPLHLNLWLSESAAGIGLTADTYSGTLTATAGAIQTTLTAKKEFSVVTNAAGVFTGTLVDSANPTDQYVAISGPGLFGVHVSGASGTNWEGV